MEGIGDETRREERKGRRGGETGGNERTKRNEGNQKKIRS